MNETMRIGLQEPENTPQVFSTSEESFNSKSLDTNSMSIMTDRKMGNASIENSMSDSPVGCGYNSSERKRGNVPKHKVSVIGFDGKPLTPTTNTKARKLKIAVKKIQKEVGNSSSDL